MVEVTLDMEEEDLEGKTAWESAELVLLVLVIVGRTQMAGWVAAVEPEPVEGMQQLVEKVSPEFSGTPVLCSCSCPEHSREDSNSSR